MKPVLQAFAFAALFALLGAPAHAQEVKAGDLVITQAWSRATPGGAKIAGGFLTIENKGAAPDRLIGGSGDIAGKVEIHEMAMNNGVMTMRPLDKGLAIEPGKTVKLAPGGYHLMLMDLKNPLKQGDKVPLTLEFEKAGKVTLSLDVQGVGAQAPAVGGSGARSFRHEEVGDSRCRKLLVVAIALAALAASPAAAHVTLEKRQAPVGSYYKAVFAVPHGCAGSPTVKLRVQIPEGVIGIKPMPKPGWTVETVKGKYAAEYDFHGSKLSEGVKEVVWSGGKLADDNYDEFVFSSFLTARPEAGHHAVFSGGAGMRAGGQPLDRYSLGGRRQRA